MASLDHHTLPILTAALEQVSLVEPKSPASCGLLDLPTELRLAIAEHVFQKHPAILNVDLRRQAPEHSRCFNACSFIMTCRQIHKECAKIRYEVNDVIIYAPVFTAEPLSVSDRKAKEDIAGRLSKLAVLQTNVHQLRRTTLILGQLPNLRALRWMDFMVSWLLVRDAIVSLREHVRGMVFAFGVYLSSGLTARVEMCADSPKTVIAGPVHCRIENDTEAELSDADSERLRKMKTTIAKTLFPKWTSQI